MLIQMCLAQAEAALPRMCANPGHGTAASIHRASVLEVEQRLGLGVGNKSRISCQVEALIQECLDNQMIKIITAEYIQQSTHCILFPSAFCLASV